MDFRVFFYIKKKNYRDLSGFLQDLNNYVLGFLKVSNIFQDFLVSFGIFYRHLWMFRVFFIIILEFIGIFLDIAWDFPGFYGFLGF